MTTPPLPLHDRDAQRTGAASAVDARRLAHLRIALIALASLLPAAALLGELSLASQLAAVALPVATLGVMHGALDPWVGKLVWMRRFGRYSRVGFYSSYVSLAALVVGCWILAPLPTLIAFLAVSVVHFGEQDAAAFQGRADPLGVVVHGAVPVLGPVVGQPGEVAAIFGWLAGLDPVALTELLAWGVKPLAAIWFVGAGMLLSRIALQGRADLSFQFFGLAVVVAVMVLLPPLIAFAAYFCLIHSFGHLFALAASGSGPWRDWSLVQWTARLWPATLATLSLGLAGLVLLRWLGPGEVAVEVHIARVVFCGLAALTVPHVLLHRLLPDARGC